MWDSTISFWGTTGLAQFELLGQSEKITNWFSPIWVISVGVAMGLVLVLILAAKIFLLSKISPLNRLAENRNSFLIVGTLSTVVLTALAFGLIYWYYGWAIISNEQMQGSFALLAGFIIPIAAIIGFGQWLLISKRRAAESLAMFREGFLSWISMICLALTGFAAVGLLLDQFDGFGMIKFVDDPRGILESLTRMPAAKEYQLPVVEIPPSTGADSGTPVAVNFPGPELQFVKIQSNQQLELAAQPITATLARNLVYIVPSTSSTAGAIFPKGSFVQDEFVENFYVVNRGASPATVNIAYRLAPVYGEVVVIPWIATWILLTYLLYLCGSVLMPKVAAISLATFKTEISQPLYLLVAILGALFIVISVYIPYNTFGEDIKMYKDSGLTMLRVLAIFVAIWAAGKSVSEEIEGRTALTVLSKPVGRLDFVLGKFSGISFAVALLFVGLGLWFIIWVAYKPVYDAVESSRGEIQWSECFAEAVKVTPAIFLSFLEVLIFVAVSVAISTRMGLLPNLMICFAVYVLGHLTPQLLQSQKAAQAFEPVQVFGNFIAIIFPVLDHYDVPAAINTNSLVPLEYLGWSIVYTLLYSGVAILLALLLFEDRDLA